MKLSKYPQSPSYADGFGGDDELCDVNMMTSAADVDIHDNDVARYVFHDNTYRRGFGPPLLNRGSIDISVRGKNGDLSNRESCNVSIRVF